MKVSALAEYPSYCQIDRKIIKKVESDSDIASWTKLDDIDDY